jgi:predicted Zn finger-like uncharacterized protein
MKVTCQSCQAKYTIADEKVRGKVAKIRCKKCGTTIVVNGAEGSVDSAAAPSAADYTHQGPADEQWTVLVADGDQRPVTAAQIAELYANGHISYETHAWKDGMPEWLPIASIDALRSVLDNGPRPTMTPLGDHAPAMAAAAPAMEAAKPARLKTGLGAPQPAASRNDAARRPGRGGATDLFGSAGGDDIMTSASADPQLAGGGQDKPTGARNENSVLFSLSALTATQGTASPVKGSFSDTKAPDSSQADLRALLGPGNGAAPAKSKLDDIMNLGGGALYTPAMVSPVLAPPPVDFAAMTEPEGVTAKPKSKTALFAIVGGVVLIGAVAVGLGAFGGKSDTADKASPGGTTSAAAGAPTTPTAAGEPTKEAPAAEQPAAATAEPAPAAVAPGAAAAKPTEADKASRTAAAAPPKADKPPPAAPEPRAAAPAAAPAPAPPPAAGGASFDRVAAVSALSAIATGAQSCKRPDGPTGSGRVAVTISPSGNATTATIEGPPFAGTPVGGCVAAKFRSVHVPAFSGDAVTVHKTFFVN